MGTNQFMSQVSSTVTEILSDKDMNSSGSKTALQFISIISHRRVLFSMRFNFLIS